MGFPWDFFVRDVRQSVIGALSLHLLTAVQVTKLYCRVFSSHTIHNTYGFRLIWRTILSVIQARYYYSIDLLQ